MKKLKDFVSIGSMEDMVSNFKNLGKNLSDIGSNIKSKNFSDLECRVYAQLADAASRQIILLAKHAEEPIEINANICRTIFEINILFRYCLSSVDRLNAFADQSGTDEISIYKGIRSLQNENTDPKYLEQLEKHIIQIRSILQKHNRNLYPERKSASQMAKDVGAEKEYEAFYGFYSKYVHASAWLIIRNREDIDLPLFRSIIYLQAQAYSWDILGRLNCFIERKQKLGKS